MKSNYITLCFIFSFSLFSMVSISAQVFVKADATGNNDGTSWENAYTNLQVAVDENIGDTLWVAAGEWHPTVPGGDETISFLINSNIELYGGFAGVEVNFTERDIIANPTILSGDLNDDDLLNDLATNRLDNSQTVMIIANTINNNTVIDGFTFSGGHADGPDGINPAARGGGIFCTGLPIVRNCTFKNNYSNSRGGGFNAYINLNIPDSLHLDNCTFFNNKTETWGGGLHFESISSSETINITNSSFIENNASNGGGIAIIERDDNSHALVINCNFESNEAIYSGGLHIEPEGNACTYHVLDCVFTENKAIGNSSQFYNRAGGLFCFFDPGATNSFGLVEGCQFIDNTSDEIGGGLHIIFQSNSNAVEVRSCFFEGNSATTAGFNSGGAALSVELNGFTCNLDISKCIFEDNLTAGVGGAIDIRGFGDLDAKIKSSTFIDNMADNAGLSIYSRGSTGNPDNQKLLIENNLFIEHGMNSLKSIIHNTNNFDVKIINSTITNNEAIGIEQGASGTMSIQNNILHNPDGLNVLATTPIISLGGNVLTDDSMEGALISSDQEVDDPEFLGTGDFPYQLSELSPAINRGLIYNNISEFDLAGNIRLQNDSLDAGAYESPYFAISVGLKEIQKKSILNVTPNPIEDMAILSLENDWRGEIKLQILNLKGQEIGFQKLTKHSEKASWNINELNLSAGIYFLLLSHDDSFIQQKLIKQ